MKIAVVGTGHVGLVTAACLAHIGHEVTGIDGDAVKVRTIASGESPFHEPGLQELIREGLGNGRLRVTEMLPDAVRAADVIFVSVGTPSEADGAADLRQVERVAADIAGDLAGYTVVAEKSTVPVGTGESMRRSIEASAAKGAEFDVASNPEFLQEGRAVQDTLEPSRIVLGVSSDRAAGALREVYRPIVERTGCPVILTDIATAELVKHASNAFLATKISFINHVAEICDAAGADVETVAEAMGLDHRIGPAFLRAGIGYGGACFPKDVRAFRHRAGELGVDFALLDAVDRINESRREAFAAKIRDAVGGSLEGKRVALWGVAFKPDTDDLRNAPAVDVAQRLLAAGASVTAHDPAAMAEAKNVLPDVRFCDDPYEAAADAHCVAICTDWDLYAAADSNRLREVMASPVIVDGRNVLDPAEMAAAGFRYLSMGRPPSGNP